MARFEFRLPDIGEGIAEAEIVAWHIQVGARVEEDQNIADMMTDKATVEMESPVAGVVVALGGEVGDQVPIGATLVVIETETAQGEAAQEEAPQQLASSDGGAVKARGAGAKEDELECAEAPPAAAAPAEDVPAAVEQSAAARSARDERGAARKVFASPAVRQRARELRVDLGQVAPADGDRIRHSDLDAFLRYNARHGYGGYASPRQDEVVRVLGMRRRIAENMAASKRHIPHFSYVDEIDVTELERMRADLNANRGDRPKLTLLPFLIVALCRTLPQFPMLNARYDDEAGVVTRHGPIHLGIATQTDAGLTVPVIRNAQDRNLWQLAAEVARLAEAARAGKLTPSDLGGGTITLTSLGPLGGIATTPVINRPEVAIIGPNKIVDRPVFRGDAIVRAKLMNLSISCDHRVVDGWDAASYVQLLRRYLETPVLLFAPEGAHP
jgi:2-oxoisovalerate dehydrogenase E2 component (dihydrolipoyl transacylase)